MGKALNLQENNGKRSIAVIPCYNEEYTIGSVSLKAKKHVDEVLVVDDGSTDETAKIAKKAGAKVISHKYNMGKSAGIKTGFSYAMANKYEYVVTLDGDAQHNPHEIPLLLTTLKNNGHDITLGTRWGKKTEMPLWRKFGKRILDYTTSLGNGGFVTDSQCGFRAFNKKAIENLTPRLNGKAFAVESEQLIRAHDLGLHVATKSISCKYKDLDTSTKGPASHGFSVLRSVLRLVAAKRPLLFISFPGLFLFLLGFLLGYTTFQAFDQSAFFNMGYLILVTILMIIGALAVFIGLLLNVIPTMLKPKNY